MGCNVLSIIAEHDAVEGVDHITRLHIHLANAFALHLSAFVSLEFPETAHCYSFLCSMFCPQKT